VGFTDEVRDELAHEVGGRRRRCRPVDQIGEAAGVTLAAASPI